MLLKNWFFKRSCFGPQIVFKSISEFEKTVFLLQDDIFKNYFLEFRNETLIFRWKTIRNGEKHKQEDPNFLNVEKPEWDRSFALQAFPAVTRLTVCCRFQIIRRRFQLVGHFATSLAKKCVCSSSKNDFLSFRFFSKEGFIRVEKLNSEVIFVRKDVFGWSLWESSANFFFRQSNQSEEKTQKRKKN